MNMCANPGLAMDFHLAANIIPFFVSELFVSWLLNDVFVLALYSCLSHLHPLPLLKRLSYHLQNKKLDF